MPTFSEVVAAHHTESDAVLVAGSEPCITLAAEERKNVRGRSFRVVSFGDLPKLKVRASWIMAVLLCPADDAGPIADWLLSAKRDPRRVIFYVHPGTDVREALRPWHQAGLPVHATWTVSDWKALHKHLGAHWNVRIFDDFRPRG
jgi:hypothetical protein